MESEFLINIKEISIEVIIISILVFGLTMLIKWPIKRITAKLEENKRKAVNTVIVLIPLLLSFVFSVLYYGIFKKSWFVMQSLETSGSSYLLAVSLYAIFSRIVIIIKGTKDNNQGLDREAIKYIKQNIKAITKTLKLDEQKLEQKVTEIEKLLNTRDEIVSSLTFQDISTAEKLDNEISSLKQEQDMIMKSIEFSKELLLSYQNSLKKKGE